jgi:hypothetical protein
MSTARPIVALDRYTEIGTISLTMRQTVRRLMVPLVVVLTATSLYLIVLGRTGGLAFAAMSLGTCIALAVWGAEAIGLPLLPMMVAQNLIIYGVPILASHENILVYPSEYVLDGGLEVMTFDLALALAWAIGMRVLSPSPPVSYVLHEVNKEGAKGWRRMGFFMILAATSFQVLAGFNLLDALYGVLPSGSDSLINTLVSVLTACGFFLVSMVISGTDTPTLERILFWSLLTANCLMSASSLLLAGTAAYLASVTVGLFWGGGKVPWRFLTISILALAFYNVGKTTMRERYWVTEEAKNTNLPIKDMPACFSEWSVVSFNAILQNDEARSSRKTDAEYQATKNQTLLDRVDNLQNLLFVIDAMDNGHVKPLMGKTYSLIPPLLVPRILWPDKPRSHEGQVLLNVHFGRQDLNSTYTTYIAWGLLPEAYGNFGPYAGSISLGLFLGAFFAWIEKHTARKLLVSAEGFISLSLFMNLMNSFEMVASVLVTSTFQSIVIVVLACTPFVRLMTNPRPHAEEN